MTEIINPKIFITGIPTAGKTYLSRKLAKATGGYCLETDALRDELVKDPKYNKWENFFDEKNEYAYYTDNDPEEQWRLLSEQHEQLWPGVLKKIREYGSGHIPLKSIIAGYLRKPLSKKRPIIFEGINILPRLAKKDLDFPGVVLIGKSLEEVLERNRQRPRWGKTEEMLKMGAEAFWYVERPRYIAEAEDCGYKIFEDADEAYAEIVKILDLK
ncbi:MAG: AAA family ATPase [Candidatus Paceibacterota bacterium]